MNTLALRILNGVGITTFAICTHGSCPVSTSMSTAMPVPIAASRQADLPNRFFHATGAQLRNVTQDADDALFSLAYLHGFAPFDSPDRFSGDVTPFANFVC